VHGMQVNRVKAPQPEDKRFSFRVCNSFLNKILLLVWLRVQSLLVWKIL
jgi:hypothetical protein